MAIRNCDDLSHVHGATVEAGTDIGRAAKLAAFEDEGSDLAGLAQLRLDLAMEEQLHAVETERLDGACLGMTSTFARSSPMKWTA